MLLAFDALLLVLLLHCIDDDLFKLNVLLLHAFECGTSCVLLFELKLENIQSFTSISIIAREINIHTINT